MIPAIRVDRLSKSYSLQAMSRGSRTFADTVMDLLGAPVRALRGTQRAAPGPVGPATIFWALKDVSFEVKPGEVIGVIGPNGAGKSTLFKILSRITRPSAGQVEINGRLGSLLEVGTGFHPELTGRENVFLNGAILGMSRKEIEAKFDEIVAFADIDQFLDMPVKRYSSGMYLRLAFAVAASLEPEILLLDEVMAVGDREFQEKSARRIRDLTQQGITTLMISHNPSAIEHLVQRCLYIRSGQIAYDGKLSGALTLYYAHIHEEQKLKEEREKARREQKLKEKQAKAEAEAKAKAAPAEVKLEAKAESRPPVETVEAANGQTATAAARPVAAHAEAATHTNGDTKTETAVPVGAGVAELPAPAGESGLQTAGTPRTAKAGTPFLSVATLDLALNPDLFPVKPPTPVVIMPDPEEPNAILAVRAANPAGDPELNQGDNLVITVRYRASANLRQVRFQVSLWTEAGVLVTCADTRLMDQPESPVREEGEATCVFPALPLVPAKYLVKVIMFNPIIDWNPIATFGIHGDPRGCWFVVKPRAEPLVTGGGWFPAHADFGVVKLPFEWRGET